MTFKSNDPMPASAGVKDFLRDEFSRAVRRYFRPITWIFEDRDPPSQMSIDPAHSVSPLKPERVELRGYALRNRRR